MGKEPNFPKLIDLHSQSQDEQDKDCRFDSYALASSLIVRMSPLGIFSSTVCPSWMVSSRVLGA